MKVLKFGGTSMASAESLSRVVDIIYHHQQRSKVFCVVSAAAGVTDQLYKLATIAEKGIDFSLEFDQLKQRHLDMLVSLDTTQKSIAEAGIESRMSDLNTILTGVKLLAECTQISLDNIVTHGEIFSSFILHSLLNSKNLRINLIEAKKYVLLLNSDTAWKLGTVKKDFVQIANQLFESSNVIVSQGFIALDMNNVVCTLGRGGSDYSAGLFAATLDADELLIYSDVDGIYNCDPRIYDKAKLLLRLSYNSIKQLAYWGVKAFHPFSIKPAIEKNVKVIALNTFNNENEGTEIVAEEIEFQNFPMAIFKNALYIDILADSDKPEKGFFKLSQMLAFATERMLISQIEQSSMKFVLSDELSQDIIKASIFNLLPTVKVNISLVSSILILGDYHSKISDIIKAIEQIDNQIIMIIQEPNCLKIVCQRDNINEKVNRLRDVLDN